MKRFKLPKGKYWDFPTQQWRKYSTAQRALKIAKKVDKKQKQTTEYISSGAAVTAGTLNATPVVVHQTLNTSATGSFDGLECIVKSCRILFHVKAGSALPEYYRCDLVLDRKPTAGTIATVAQIYKGAAAIPLDIANQNNRDRFKILRSFIGYVNTNDGGMAFHQHHRRLNLKAETGSIGSYSQGNQIKNALLVVHWTGAAANQPTYTMQVRTCCVEN